MPSRRRFPGTRYNLAMDITPLLKQYQEIKSQHQDELLLFRMGDFYELFFEDAEVASKVLGIVLTSKPMGKNHRVPMAGVPVKAAESYIAKLLKAGYRVAICEQIGEPRPGKGPMRREVVEVITPGTILEPALLQEKEFNYLASLYPGSDRVGVALLDLTTGDFALFEAEPTRARVELEKRKIAEVILPEDVAFEMDQSPPVYSLPSWHFDPETARRALLEFFGTQTLDAFEVNDLPRALGAAHALLEYVRERKPGMLEHLKGLRRLPLEDRMYLDRATLKNLEVLEPIHPEGTALVDILDETLTAMGGRFLREALVAPLLDVEQIRTRLIRVQSLVEDPGLLESMRKALQDIPDLERTIARVSARKSGPREVRKLAEGIRKFEELRSLLLTHEVLAPLVQDAPDLTSLADDIERTLVDDPPVSTRDEVFIRSEASPELQELRDLAHNSKSHLLQLEQQERERTGIPNLRIGFNNVFGYYIEVTKAHLHRVPAHYIRKQTLVNAERFITPELKDLEARILSAEERARKLELELWNALRGRILEHTQAVKDLASRIAELDFYQALSTVARKRKYTRPEIREDGVLEIEEGRHPMVEAMSPEPFIPNDTKMNLTSHRIYILTGPNMSGKSTYLRQVALIVLMAQIGSFVPAKHAKIGIVDRIFTRIGASDDLARGVSTFLAEMVETAQILRNATERSLIILDEVGRGTSTYDGFAIAWAVVEYILKRIGAKTLFATHYHQLSQLGKRFPGVQNYTLQVKEWEGKVVFLRKVVPGETDRSYGIHVAQLAGVPEEVVIRAREVQEDLEREGIIRTRLTQLSLFDPPPSRRPDKLRKMLKELDLDGLTPRDALNFLYRLKEEVEQE